MLQSSQKTFIPHFTIRTTLGLVSRFAHQRFNDALRTYKQQSGALYMLTHNIEEDDISQAETAILPAMKKAELRTFPTLLKFTSDYPPLLAIEAAIHHHLDKCRSLPAVLYVDSQTFLPILAEQYRRVKFCDFDRKDGYGYFTGYKTVNITIATEQELDEWARASLGGSIPTNMVISAISL